MSLRKRDSRESAGREDPPEVEGTGSAVPVLPPRSSVREDAGTRTLPSAASSAVPSASAGPSVLVTVSWLSASAAPLSSPAWRSRAR